MTPADEARFDKMLDMIAQIASNVSTLAQTVERAARQPNSLVGKTFAELEDEDMREFALSRAISMGLCRDPKTAPASRGVLQWLRGLIAPLAALLKRQGRGGTDVA